MRRVAIALSFALGVACGGDDEATSERSARAEVEQLERAVHDDLELLAMEEVEDAVAEDLPVRAAELLRAGALPAARRHVERVRDLSLSTARARALQLDSVGALEARADALEQYAAALERGLIEDLQLVQALGAQRAAEERIAALMRELEAARTPPEES